MKFLSLLCGFLLLPLMALAQPALLDGDWDGTLNVPPRGQLRLSLHIETVAGAQTAILTSIDQGGAQMPVSSLTQDGNAIVLELSALRAGFKGVLSADGKTLAGSWSQGGASLPLSFTRRPPGQAAEQPKRPQTPMPPFPYHEEEVSIAGPGGTLAGTLTRPNGNGKFPAVILIQGSGPHTRDQVILGHKQFLVLADYLTRRGFAVLRVDKRGIGKSTGSNATATVADFANDVKAEVAFLKTRSDIDPGKIGLIGHSEGGAVAPMVAASDPSIAFVVLMAGVGVRGDANIQMQSRVIGKVSGIPDKVIADNDLLVRQLHAAVTGARDADDAVARLRAANANEAQIRTLSSPYMRFTLSYDPAPALAKLKMPVLAINGDKDVQVDAGQNLTAIKAALGGRAETRVLPGLNHLFQTAKTGLPAEYGQIEETMSPAALAIVGDWIAQQVGGTRQP